MQMRIRIGLFTMLLAATVLVSALLFASSSARTVSADESTATVAAAPALAQEKGGQEEFGPYELVENWPQPLPDGADGVKHAGWTWGSVGAVFAETPDRI